VTEADDTTPEDPEIARILAKLAPLVRAHLLETWPKAEITDVTLEPASGSVRVHITARRVGVLVGRKGANVDTVKKGIKEIVPVNVSINFVEAK